MSTAEENKALVKRLFEEEHVKKNRGYMHDYLDEDYIDHATNMGKVARIAASKNKSQWVYRDYQVKIEDMIAEGDKVVYRWSGWFENQNREKENYTGVDIKWEVPQIG